MSGDDLLKGFTLFFIVVGWWGRYLNRDEAMREKIPFPPERIPEINSLIAAKENIKALRKVREITGWNLRRAKEFVMELEKKIPKPL